MNKKLMILYSIFYISCWNNPTPVSEIYGEKKSGLLYEIYNCDILFEEIAFLQNREKELIISQEKRIEESNKQQGWSNGIGLGDGLDASELNNVRGEITAAQKVFDRKGCVISSSNTKDN